MANEAVIIELSGDRGDVQRFACYDGETYTKGQLVWFVDPRRASGASIAGMAQPFAGVAAADKVAGDGSTSIPVYTYGVFDLKSVDAPVITAGQFVFLSGQNLIMPGIAGVTLSGANTEKIAYKVGVALETASAGEVIAVRIG